MNRSSIPFPDPHQAHHAQRRSYRSRPHDIQNLYVSLKQWRILHAVIDCGGFAEAAKYLHLSQSAISYTVAKLQEQLGVPLLKIEGRKAHLTTAGRALLDRSRYVLKEALELELFAKQLEQGGNGEVRLVVDHHFPTRILMQALRKFMLVGRGAQVRLSEVALSRVDEILGDPSIDLAISARVPLGLLGAPLVEVEYIAVAHPEHPLLALNRKVMPADLEKEMQIETGYENEWDVEKTPGLKHRHTWTVSNFETALEAVCEGFGYAWLPKHRIQRQLGEGRIVLLPLAERHSYKSILYLIHGRNWSSSPAASWLAEVLRTLIAAETTTRHSPPAHAEGPKSISC